MIKRYVFTNLHYYIFQLKILPIIFTFRQFIKGIFSLYLKCFFDSTYRNFKKSHSVRYFHLINKNGKLLFINQYVDILFFFCHDRLFNFW